MDKLSIYPSPELLKKLEKEAEKQKRSMNNLILFILEQALKKKG